jgi:hypothetical protein
VSRTAHEVRQLLVDDLYDLLTWAESLRDLCSRGPLAYVAYEFLGDPVVHVRLKEGQAYLSRHLSDLILSEVAGVAHPIKRQA